MMHIFSCLLVLSLISLYPISALEAQGNIRGFNGFEMFNLLIPQREIYQGGPPRDGIPAINQPQFDLAAKTKDISDQDEVLGVYWNGIAKAYPIRIMDHHEIVNDLFGDKAVTVTYCPLCGSGIAFKANFDGKRQTFGVSGLLYNSDVLLYDYATESLWSQLLGKAVSGEQSGKTLDYLPTAYTTWGEWKKRYPESLVLNSNTGFNRDYNRKLYAGYEDREQLMFPVKHKSNKLPGKEKVIGIEIKGAYKAYPLSQLAKAPNPKEDLFNGKILKIYYDKEAKTARITDLQGKELPAITLYWFAWYAFHPETELFE